MRSDTLDRIVILSVLLSITCGSVTLTWQHPSSCCLLLLVYNWLALSALDVFKQWWQMLFLGGLFTAANGVWAWSGAVDFEVPWRESGVPLWLPFAYANMCVVSRHLF